MSEHRIELTDSAWDFAQAIVAQGEYPSVSAYVAGLVESDRRKQARAKLEAELQKGLDSGPSTEMTAADWQSIRDAVAQRLKTPASG